jgi:hypothetical protein
MTMLALKSLMAATLRAVSALLLLQNPPPHDDARPSTASSLLNASGISDRSLAWTWVCRCYLLLRNAGLGKPDHHPTLFLLAPGFAIVKRSLVRAGKTP